MAKVIFDMSMSLDGYVTASGMTPEEPLGAGGERLHEWVDSAEGAAMLASFAQTTGVVICGRRTYDDSLPWWGADGPTGPARLPVIVLTHRAPEKSPEGGVYRFVTGGVAEALRQARATGGDRHVVVMGGPATGQQFLAAGLVDEIGVHLVPVLLGGGISMFAQPGDAHLRLEVAEVIETPAATHLRYRVLGGPGDAPA